MEALLIGIGTLLLPLHGDDGQVMDGHRDESWDLMHVNG